MARINANDLKLQTPMAGTFGNLCYAQGAKTLSAASNGDVLGLVRLPAFTRLIDATLWAVGSTGSLTGRLGYLPVDGSAGDDDFFIAAGLNISGAGRHRAAQSLAPIVVEKEFDVVLTLAGANIASARTFTVGVLYEYLNR